MQKKEFDQFAGKYDEILSDSVSSSVSETAYFAEYKIKLVSNLLSDRSPRKILDYGCGSGRSLPYLSKYFPDAEVWGYDVSTVSLEVARQTSPDVVLTPDWDLVEKGGFDIIFAANVFHHIVPEQRRAALINCRNALEPDGRMIIFEHNPYNPVTRWIFEHCPLDVDAKMLSLREALGLSGEANFNAIDRGYTLFFPAQLAWFRRFEPALRSIPLGAQYYVQLEK